MSSLASAYGLLIHHDGKNIHRLVCVYIYTIYIYTHIHTHTHAQAQIARELA